MVLIYPVVFVMCDWLWGSILCDTAFMFWVPDASFLVPSKQALLIVYDGVLVESEIEAQVNMNYCFQPLWVRVLSLAHNGCYLSEREVRIVPIWRDRSRVASQGRPNRIYGLGDLGEQCVSNTASVCIIYNYLVFVHIHYLLCLSVFSTYSFMLL